MRIQDHDLFVARIQGSSPFLWQRQPQGPKLLYQLPSPFDDSFATLQEWEFDVPSEKQTVRLDFLHRIAMAPSTPFESPSFFAKYRAATLGGYNHSVVKEIERYHSVDQLLPDTETGQIFKHFNFFGTGPEDRIAIAFSELDHFRTTPEPRVELTELIDTVESIPTAILSAETLETIHDLRHRRHQRRQRGTY